MKTRAETIETIQTIITAQQALIREMLTPLDFTKRVCKGLKNVRWVKQTDLLSTFDPGDPGQANHAPRLWYSDGPQFGRITTATQFMDICFINDPVQWDLMIDNQVTWLRDAIKQYRKYRYILDMDIYVRQDAFEIKLFSHVFMCDSDKEVKPPEPIVLGPGGTTNE